MAPNLEGSKQLVTNMRIPFADLHGTIEDIIAEGDKVVVRWTYIGKHTSEFIGVPPTGKQVTVTGISITHIVDGKIVEEWGEMDSMGMMQQLGVVPPPT